eukprot:jgi/Botrbrau1/339/Bobra.0022s0293.1
MPALNLTSQDSSGSPWPDMPAPSPQREPTARPSQPELGAAPGTGVPSVEPQPLSAAVAAGPRAGAWSAQQGIAPSAQPTACEGGCTETPPLPGATGPISGVWRRPDAAIPSAGGPEGVSQEVGGPSGGKPRESAGEGRAPAATPKLAPVGVAGSVALDQGKRAYGPASGPAPPEILPAAPEGSPAASNVSPAAPEVSPAAPEVSPATPEVSPAKPELPPAAPEISPAAPDVSPAAPEVLPVASEASLAAPQIAPVASQLSPTRAQIRTSGPEVLPAAPQLPTAAPAGPQVSPAVATPEVQQWERLGMPSPLAGPRPLPAAGVPEPEPPLLQGRRFPALVDLIEAGTLPSIVAFPLDSLAVVPASAPPPVETPIQANDRGERPVLGVPPPVGGRTRNVVPPDAPALPSSPKGGDLPRGLGLAPTGSTTPERVLGGPTAGLPPELAANSIPGGLLQQVALGQLRQLRELQMKNEGSPSGAPSARDRDDACSRLPSNFTIKPNSNLSAQPVQRGSRLNLARSLLQDTLPSANPPQGGVAFSMLQGSPAPPGNSLGPVEPSPGSPPLPPGGVTLPAPPPREASPTARKPPGTVQDPSEPPPSSSPPVEVVEHTPPPQSSTSRAISAATFFAKTDPLSASAPAPGTVSVDTPAPAPPGPPPPQRLNNLLASLLGGTTPPSGPQSGVPPSPQATEAAALPNQADRQRTRPASLNQAGGQDSQQGSGSTTPSISDQLMSGNAPYTSDMETFNPQDAQQNSALSILNSITSTTGGTASVG